MALVGGEWPLVGGECPPPRIGGQSATITISVPESTSKTNMHTQREGMRGGKGAELSLLQERWLCRLEGVHHDNGEDQPKDVRKVHGPEVRL